MRSHTARWLVLSFWVSAFILCAGCGGLPKYLAKTPMLTAPPSGKALVNFHRPTGYGGGALYPIFNGEGKFICDLPGESLFQYPCDAGKQVFVGWAEHVSVVEAEVEANKTYDIMVDVGMGWVSANIKMAPLAQGDPRRAKLPEFEKREKNVLAMQRNEHVIQYEQKSQARFQEIKKDFLGGAKGDRVLRLKQSDCR